MAIDPYGPCPGGTGKKVKFCCPDLVNELDKITRMLDGDQPQACLDHITSLEAKHPGRACLCTLKASLQAELGQADQARASIETLLQTHPDNPIALADQAMLIASQQGPQAAAPVLSRALTASKGQIMPQVYAAIGEIAAQMIAGGHYLAARAHFLLQARLNPQDSRPVQALVQISTPREIPLLFKDDARFWPAPEDAPWRAEFDAAVHLAHGVEWYEAGERFARLSERHPESPAIWHNLAVIRGWLGDEPGMMEALRKVSSFEAPRLLPVEDAVEAEAMAILVDPVFNNDVVDELIVTFPVTDIEKLLTQLGSDRRAKSVPIEAVQSNPDQPPPRSAYWLLDKPIPETGKNLTLEQVPSVLATIAVYGRETDRAPRIEAELFRSDLRRATDLLVELCGDAVGISSDEQVVNRVQSSQMILSWHWRLPDDTPTDVAESLVTQQRRTTVLNRWSKLPQAVLGGKSPDQVAGDASQRTKLLAVTFLLELALDHHTATPMVNELRGRLGLPILGTIDPTTTKIAELPLVRLSRVQIDKTSDDDLVVIYRKGSMAGARIALKRASLEILNRPSLDAKIAKDTVYGMLSRLEEDPERAGELLTKARETAEAAGRSGAEWALDELVFRMRRGQASEAGRLLQHIQGTYGRDPNVRMALMQILQAFGIVGPDGRPTGGLGGPAAPANAPSILPPAGGAQPGKLWTPDGETGGGGVGGGKKPVIWTPGS
jgi:hypothetical protein